MKRPPSNLFMLYKETNDAVFGSISSSIRVKPNDIGKLWEGGNQKK